MAIGTVVSTVIAGDGVVVKRVEDVAEERVGVVVGMWRIGERSAARGRAFESRDEGKLAVGRWTDEQADMGQIGMGMDDVQKCIEHQVALEIGEFFDARFERHGLASGDGFGDENRVRVQINTYRDLAAKIVNMAGGDFFDCEQRFSTQESVAAGVRGRARPRKYFLGGERNGLVWSIAAERRKCCDFACSPVKTTQKLVPKM